MQNTTSSSDKARKGAIIQTVHCQCCGTSDLEYVGHEALRAGEGYTACCNERAIYPGTDYAGRPSRCGDDCYHE